MRWWTLIILLCCSAAENTFFKDEWKEVKIKQGPVRGYRDSSGEIWTFYNIPYATAPTHKHKFKAPLPPLTWSKPFEAINNGIIICPQFRANIVKYDGTKMQENCLVANIFVPDTKKKNLPVMVHFHGGGYQIGYGNLLRMQHFMMYKDFIVVNFNYRLGIHGFLCLGTEDIPGNAGMKDQVALLRWVQQNIGAFGGNPNDVTIEGFSAGSTSVDLLMISKAAEGLFHKVIPESGSSLSVFTVQTDPLQNAKDHAKKLNCTNLNDILALQKFYQKLSYETLTSDGFGNNTDSTFTFSPCVEPETAVGTFLTESPIAILETGDYKKVPLLYGFTNMEGMMRIQLFDMWKDRMNKKFSDFLPADLKFKCEAEKEAVAKIIKEYYFGDEPVSKHNVLGYVDFFTDVLFAQATLWAVKLHIENGHNELYLYEYSFADKDTPVVPHTNIRGAYHCAQTIALANGTGFTQYDEDHISEEYKNMKKIVRKIWHNFIITGKPVLNGSHLPAWPAVGGDISPYMSLNKRVQLRGSPLVERRTFWQNIYQKYYKEPIPPSYTYRRDL